MSRGNRQLSVRASETMHSLIEEAAVREGVTKSEWVVAALEEQLSRERTYVAPVAPQRPAQPRTSQGVTVGRPNGRIPSMITPREGV